MEFVHREAVDDASLVSLVMMRARAAA